ncbi:MAG: ferrochelatase, partial [Alphaproteobacteria bacterium]|nr:ferrochelatase [Alphaproteobacteria bacterium]
EYRHKAETAGVPAYVRVPAVAEHPRFIEGLAQIVRRAAKAAPGECGREGGKICSGPSRRCAFGRALGSL